MAKGGGKQTSNLLNLSGMIFAVIGAFHILRYFDIVRSFDFTRLGSLLIGCFLICLAVLCLAAGKR